MSDFKNLSSDLGKLIIRDHSFKKFNKINRTSFAAFEDISIWRRRTINTNRAIVLIKLSNHIVNNINNIGEYAQEIKIKLGKEIGYIFFIYSLGLQIIFYGDDIIGLADNLEDYVDKYDNQRVVLQSIHILDRQNKKNKSVRTWGQWFTGKYQNLIEEVIEQN